MKKISSSPALLIVLCSLVFLHQSLLVHPRFIPLLSENALKLSPKRCSAPVMSPPPLLAHSVLWAAEAMSSPLPPQSQEPKEAPFPQKSMFSPFFCSQKFMPSAILLDPTSPYQRKGLLNIIDFVNFGKMLYTLSAI